MFKCTAVGYDSNAFGLAQLDLLDYDNVNLYGVILQTCSPIILLLLSILK